MKYIRLLLLSLLFLFGVVTVMSLFIPSRVRISKAINIHTNTAGVDSLVGDMRQWENWNPFFADVPKEEIQFAPADAQQPAESITIKGTTVKWLQRSPAEYVAEMSRDSRKSVHNGWNVITYGTADSLTVQWYMDFHLNWYPWEKFGSLLFERSYSGKMEQGLTNLKRKLEE